jgi:hypothetical protein
MRKLLVLVTVLMGLLPISIADAVPTKLIVHAKSKDAKFVGTKMGGARVVVKESETGKVLAEGLTLGATGSTQKIMIEPKTRFGLIADGAAKFETSIDIDEPTLITIEVTAPLITKPNMITTSTQTWMIPGKDIAGEGMVIEIPGFSVDARTLKEVKLSNNAAAIPIQAQIVMI